MTHRQNSRTRFSSGFVGFGTARLSVRKIRTRDERAEAYRIRLRVFVKEQGVPKEIELDRDDERAAHFLARLGVLPVGTARVVINRGKAKIGRMAVIKRHRGKGIGRKLLRGAVGWARRHGAKTVVLNAQVPVMGFYEKMNFRAVGSTFQEAGIRHRRMVLLKTSR